MRILSNDLVKFIEAQSGLTKEDKALTKLMAMLESSSDKSLTLSAQLKTLGQDLQRLAIEGVGVLDMTIPEPPPDGDVSIKAKLVEGRIQLQLEAQQPSVGKTVVPSEPIKLASNAATWLEQLKLPKNEHFLEAAQLLDTYKIEPSAEKIKLLAEGSFLASKLKSTAPEAVAQLVAQLSERYGSQGHEGSINFKQMAVALLAIHEKPVEAPSATVANLERDSGRLNVDAARTEAEVALEQPNSVKQGLTNSLKAVLKDFDAKQLITLLTSGDFSVENLELHKKIFISQEIGNRKHEILDALKGTLSKEQIADGLKQQLVSLLEGADNPAEEQSLAVLKQMVDNNEMAFPKALKEQIEQLLKATEQLNKLPDYMNALHMPLMVGARQDQLEVYYKKRQQRSSDEPFRMLIALNTVNYSQVKVLLTDTPKALSLNFKLADESVQAAFEAEKNELLGWIEAIAQKPISLTFEHGQAEMPVLEAMRFLSDKSSSQFDARV